MEKDSFYVAKLEMAWKVFEQSGLNFARQQNKNPDKEKEAIEIANNIKEIYKALPNYTDHNN